MCSEYVRAMNARTQSTAESRTAQAESLQMILKAVVVAKLTYASPAWWGFTTVDDRNRMDGLLRRAGESTSTTGLRLRR